MCNEPVLSDNATSIVFSAEEVTTIYQKNVDECTKMMQPMSMAFLRSCVCFFKHESIECLCECTYIWRLELFQRFPHTERIILYIYNLQTFSKSSTCFRWQTKTNMCITKFGGSLFVREINSNETHENVCNSSSTQIYVYNIFLFSRLLPDAFYVCSICQML